MQKEVIDNMFIKIIFIIILLAIGIWTGRFTLNSKFKYFDFCLVLFILLPIWIGTNSYLLKIFDFEIKLSFSIQLILLGILIKRVASLYIPRWRIR